MIKPELEFQVWCCFGIHIFDSHRKVLGAIFIEEADAVAWQREHMKIDVDDFGSRVTYVREKWTVQP